MIEHLVTDEEILHTVIIHREIKEDRIKYCIRT